MPKSVICDVSALFLPTRLSATVDTVDAASQAMSYTCVPIVFLSTASVDAVWQRPRSHRHLSVQGAVSRPAALRVILVRSRALAAG